MKGLIVVPDSVKISNYEMNVIEKVEDLIAVCSFCAKELNPKKLFCSDESKKVYCSKECMTFARRYE